MWRRLAWLAIALSLGACAMSRPEPSGTVTGAETGRPHERPMSSVNLSEKARQALARRGIQPHDNALLTVRSQCSRVDEIGTDTRLNLAVDVGEVGAFRADVTIKGRGKCHFDLADFHQESRSPLIVLRHARDSRCTVRMWHEQREKVTIAFSGCHTSCDGRTFDYLWPILVERESGRCF